MDTSELDYDLPSELIAQHPLGRRDASRQRLQDPDGRRSRRQDALGRSDALPCLGPDRVALAVQLVRLERVRRERAERVEADVKGDALDVEPPEQLRREVQPGSRRRGRAGLVRIDGLVPGRVGERLGDVRRQRRFAVGLAVEPDAPAALAQVLEQLDRAVPTACLEPAGRARKCEPFPIALVLEQEDFALGCSIRIRAGTTLVSLTTASSSESSSGSSATPLCRTAPVARS